MNRCILISFLSIFFLWSCNNAPKSEDDTMGAVQLLPIVNNEETAASIFLKLLDKTDGDTSISYAAKALYRDDTVGIIIEVDKDVPAGINPDGSVNEETGFRKGTIKFKKSGKESDRFVAALAQLWQIEGINSMKGQAVQPLAFSSNKTTINHNKPSTSSFKLFFNEDSPVPGEVFFTFDTYKRMVEFQVKSPSHRSSILAALAEPH
ncbi:hypothetical protein ACFOET_02050 [Parapedobacter deserti]|uniref:Lipoprotein n=1 Tax=Parapedobacter deserti TaxID=1912957 RepID=A0ABV7JH25_9SPHI